MVLVNGAEVLAWAVNRRAAAGSFNTYNAETTRAIIAGAEAEQAPIFLAVGRGALDHAGFENLAALARAAADHARVPVALHLDHATDLDLVAWAVAAGFSSVMVDGSGSPLADNIKLARQARALVGERALEAELGGRFGDEDRTGPDRSIDVDGGAGVGVAVGDGRGWLGPAVGNRSGADHPGDEDRSAPHRLGGVTPPVPMTDPDDAATLVEATGINSLAVAIGNAHGLYRGEPRLDLARLDAIAARVTVPLVLHGGTGLSPDQLRATIQRGVRKINVNTELRRAFFDALGPGLARPDHGYDLPGLLQPAIDAMSVVVRTMIRTFRLDS